MSWRRKVWMSRQLTLILLVSFFVFVVDVIYVHGYVIALVVTVAVKWIQLW